MSFFASLSNYVNSVSAFVLKNKLYTNEEIKALPKKHKSIKSTTFSQALKVTPKAESVQDIFKIAEHAYSAFLYAPSSVHSQLSDIICGRNNYEFNDDWVERVGKYSALYGYINNKPFICCRFNEDNYSQQHIYISDGKYYLYASQESYNKGYHPLIVHISEPNTTSQTFIQLSDNKYIDCNTDTLISCSTKSYNDILDLLKERKITELSEDVKSAIAGTYQIPDDIKKLYITAVQEQRNFDSRANNPR